MASAINSFETIESIRFFASLVGTDGVSDKVKEKVNMYLEKLVDSLAPSVNETVAKAAGITLIN